jgi:hypothetical protein
LGHQRQQLFNGQDRVAEDAVTDRGASGLSRIIGDMPQPQSVRQVIAGDVGVVAEDGRADDDGQVMSVQMPGQRSDRERQATPVQRMILGEGRPLGGWRGPHRGVHLLGQGDGLIPARPSGNGRAEDQDRPLRCCDRVGHEPHPGWIGADAGGSAPHDRRAQGGGLPVIQRQRQEDGARWRLDRGGVGPHERGGDVLRPGRLIGPFHPGSGLDLWLDVGQPGFEEQHPPVLLPGRDD